MKNGIYGALQWFATFLKAEGIPRQALDVPDIDFVSLARGYGVNAVHVEKPDEIESALRTALASDAPKLIEIPTAVVLDTTP